MPAASATATAMAAPTNSPTAAAGSHRWALCSPGEPAAILAFMRQSIAASAWTLATFAPVTPFQ